MAFVKVLAADVAYPKTLGHTDINQFDVYSNQTQKIGEVADVLISDAQHTYYLGINRGFLEVGRQVVLPLERFHVDSRRRRIDVEGVSESQIAHLPTYHDLGLVPHEVVVPPAHQPSVAKEAPSMSFLENSTPLETYTPLEAPILTSLPAQPQPTSAIQETHQPLAPVAAKHSSAPDRAINSDSDRLSLPLIAERLVVDRQIRKAGEVVIRREVETRLISVPIRRETLIVEQVAPEYKRLALIDLGEEQQFPVEADTDSITTGNFTSTTGNFTSTQEAIQFLQEISKQKGAQHIQIKVAGNKTAD